MQTARSNWKRVPGTLCVLLILSALGCGGGHEGAFGNTLENSTAPASLPGSTLSPAPPALAAPAARVSSGIFEPGELYQSSASGASWSGSTVSLDAGGLDLAYSVVGLNADAGLLEQVSLQGSGSAVWLGVSNYASSAWDWVAGPLDAETETTLHVLDSSSPDCYSPDGSIYLALVTTAQASLRLECSFSDAQLSVALSGPDIGNECLPLLGVNAGPYPSGEPGNPDLIEQYHAVGVNYVRTHDFYGPLDLAQMYPDRDANPTLESSFDFTESDLRWQAILDSGARPYLRLGDSFNNPTPPENPMQRARMAEACVQIIKHYMEGQWGGFNTPIDYVEIWNEPDGQFWPGHSQAEFFQFFAAVENAIHAQWPVLKVGGPGFTPAGYLTPSGQAYVIDFLDYMSVYATRLDFISWHMYSNNPQDFAEAAAWYRVQLDDNGFAAAENHITEWNTSISNDGTQTDEEIELRSGPTGAALLSASWIELQQSDVAVSCFYRGPDPNIEVPSFYGMWYADGTPKKIGEAFALWREFCHSGSFQSLELSGEGAEQLYALVGRDSESDYLLLLANTSDNAVTYSLDFQDIISGELSPVQELYRCTLREVSADDDGRAIHDLPLSTVSIPAHAVQLLKVDWYDSDD
ncbi:hypothetical protein IT575_10070 [bacterium]|nr:hypothetical protein [bacterium]